MKGNPIIQIQNVYDSLHKKEKKIADVILKQPDRIPYLSVVELAGLAETSYSSVVRFCKLMGYSGYSQFKTELAMYSYDLSEHLHYNSDTADPSDPAAKGRELLVLLSRTLEQTADHLDYGSLERAAEKISAAPLVYLFGNIYSGLAASTFHARLKSIGIPSFLSCDHQGAMQDALTLRREDVLLAFTESGYSKDTVALAKTAREKGCTVIVITTCGASPITEYCDIPIVLPLRSQSLIESRLSWEMLLQSVLSLLFVMLDARQNPQQKREYENFFSQLLREAAPEGL